MDYVKPSINFAAQIKYVMKKILITVFTISALFCSAQISKGTILAGASSNLGLSNYKPDGGISTTYFNLNAKGGYFIIDNLAVGLNMGINREDRTNYTNAQSLIGLFGRYYINGKIITGLGLGVVNNRLDINNNTTKSNYSRVTLTGGYAIFIGQVIAVEPTLNINIDGGNNKGVGLGLAVGFTLFLNRK